MALLCSCDSILPAVADVTCPQDLDQIVKIAFQKNQGSTPPFDLSGTPPVDIKDASDWATLLTSSTDNKIVLSPATASVVIPSSEASRQGENSNETVNGLGYYLGEDNIRITGEFHSIPQSVANTLAELSCFSDPTLGSSNLTAYFFLRRIAGKSRVMARGGAFAGTYYGFEIFNWRISSLGNEGYNAKTKYMFSFDMTADEWKKLEVVTLDFNPLQLANIAFSAG